MSIYEKLKLHNVRCKLRTLSCANYEHFHVYLAYRRQTGTMVTRQTYDRSPRLTRPPTAHISRGDYAWKYRCVYTQLILWFITKNGKGEYDYIKVIISK